MYVCVGAVSAHFSFIRSFQKMWSLDLQRNHIFTLLDKLLYEGPVCLYRLTVEAESPLQRLYYFSSTYI